MKRLTTIGGIIIMWFTAAALAFALAVFWYYLRIDWLKWIIIPVPLSIAVISTIFLIREPGKKATHIKKPTSKKQRAQQPIVIKEQEIAEIENQLRNCDTKDLFLKYYEMFVYSPHLSENSLRAPITAAYLFVIFDCIAFAQNKREKSYEILSLIEKEILSQSELDCYDKCVNIFGAVARGEIAPRGDWMFFDGDTGGSWLYALYLCYGDLIRYPQYISDYKNHPIIIHDYFELMKFSDNFSRTILLFTREFTDVFSNRLS